MFKRCILLFVVFLFVNSIFVFGAGGYHSASEILAGTFGSKTVYNVGEDSDSLKLTMYDSGSKVTVSGINKQSTGTGVYGKSTGSSGVGVFGDASSGFGVEGSSVSGIGVAGVSGSGYGVYGATTSGYSGYFNGTFVVGGNVGIGTGTPYSRLHIKGNSSDTGEVSLLIIEDNGEPELDIFSASSVDYLNPLILTRRSRGTINSPTSVGSGDTLFEIWGMGHSGTNFQAAGQITIRADGNPSGDTVPGYISFATSPSGGLVPVRRMIIRSDGKVGIGTESPGQLLDVNGYVKGTGLCIGADCRTSWPTGGIVSESDPQVGAVSTSYVPKWDGSALVSGTIYDNGNVGIGTSSPSVKLEVAGPIKTTESGNQLIYLGETVISDHWGADTSDDFVIHKGGWDGSSNNNYGNVVGGHFYSYGGLDVGTGSGFDAGYGNIVASGSVKGSSLCIGSDCKTSWPTSGIASESDPQVGVVSTSYVPKWDGSALSTGTIYDNGNIGIGTSSPGNKLEVSTTTANDGIRVYGSDSKWASLLSNLGNGAYNGISASGDRGIIYGGSLINSPGGGFVVAPWRSGTSGLRIDDTGKVGIGTKTPSTTLDVAGKVKATDFSICYQLMCQSGGGGWITSAEAQFGQWTPEHWVPENTPGCVGGDLTQVRIRLYAC